ncbi:MAG: chorismate synthase [Planctomycetota bacterium]
MSSTFGSVFVISTFGESHGKGVGAVVDGCPAGLSLCEEDIQAQLDRRRPGQSEVATDRKEGDQVSILSGTEKGLTLGTPIALLVRNEDPRPNDYKGMQSVPRPSHADYTYQMKYGVRACSGGGRSSARETVGRVACGAVAERFLHEHYNVEIVAWVDSVGEVNAPQPDPDSMTRLEVDGSIIRCPDPASASAMIEAIGKARDAGDSLGGVVSCVCRNVPPGWGEPVFNKLEALLAQAMLSIPAAKGFEIGSGFSGARMRGSEHNDLFMKRGDRLGTMTNRAGGVLGGISSGEPVAFRVAFKPPATIGMAQKTVDFSGNPVVFEARGRHDPCVVARAVPIVESMAALVLADLALMHKARAGKG